MDSCGRRTDERAIRRTTCEFVCQFFVITIMILQQGLQTVCGLRNFINALNISKMSYMQRWNAEESRKLRLRFGLPCAVEYILAPVHVKERFESRSETGAAYAASFILLLEFSQSLDDPGAFGLGMLSE